MKRTLIIFAVLNVTVISCRAPSKSQTKSFVGLEADIDASLLKGEAPSYLYLQKWFQGELPVSRDKAQAGGVTYEVHSNFTGQSLETIPKEFRQKLTAYLVQQSDRIAEFQSNLRNGSRLKELLKLESEEMADILMALIDVEYTPKTNDLLAHLIAHRPLRNFIDRYSVELLEKLYQRSQRSLVLGMSRENENFANLLIKNFIGNNGANDKFVQSLNDDCGKIKRMLRSMGESISVKCKASESLKLDDSDGNLMMNAESVGGSAGRTFGILGGLTSPKGFASNVGSGPQLSIFSGKDPNAGDPYIRSSSTGGGARTGPTSNDRTPTPGGSAGSGGLMGTLQQLLSGLNVEGDRQGPRLTGDRKSSGRVPRQPKGVCKGKSGLALVVCQRYVETLPTTKELFGERSNSRPRVSAPSGFNLASGYNLFLISKYGTSVQNQGTEGACTAYGNAHVLGVLGKIKGKSGEYDAQNIWERQGQEPNMDQSIAAAKGMDFDGLRISSATPLDINVDTLKRQLNSGRPVYYGSNVDSSWQNTDSGSVSCEESDGDSGHAYSIMGYDDSRNVFVIKNSWGDSWGDHGYGYLSYDCIGNQGSTEAFDLQLQ
jgi:hypothetical protein